MSRSKVLDSKRYGVALVLLIFSTLMCMWALFAAFDGQVLFYGFAAVFACFGVLTFKMMSYLPKRSE